VYAALCFAIGVALASAATAFAFFAQENLSREPSPESIATGNQYRGVTVSLAFGSLAAFLIASVIVACGLLR